MSKITVVVASRHSVWECLFSDNREVVQVLPWVPGQSWIRDLTFLKLSFFHLEVCLMILIICWLPFTCQTFVYTYVYVLTYTGPLNSMGLKCTFMWTFFSLNMYHSAIWSIDEWISRSEPRIWRTGWIINSEDGALNPGITQGPAVHCISISTYTHTYIHIMDISWFTFFMDVL